jgi:hypothetical protein
LGHGKQSERRMENPFEDIGSVETDRLPDFFIDALRRRWHACAGRRLCRRG